MRKIYILFILMVWGMFYVGSKSLGARADSRGINGTTIYLPQVFKNYQAGFGTVSGVVVDAQSGAGLGEAQVCFNLNCVQTNSGGIYQLANVPSGYQLFSARRNGFTDLEQGVVVVTAQTVTLNFALSPSLNPEQVRIVVTWGPTPEWCNSEGRCVENDLDAYLWVPGGGGFEKIYWDNRGNCDVEPFACLENDARQGSGPETMLIIKTAQSGTYKFAVHNYADAYDDTIGLPGLAPPLPQSGAVVRVYNEQGLVKTFTVPSSGQGFWWYVFNLTQSHIEEVNTIVNSPPEP